MKNHREKISIRVNVHMTKIILTQKCRHIDGRDVCQLPNPVCPIELILALKRFTQKKKQNTNIKFLEPYFAIS